MAKNGHIYPYTIFAVDKCGLTPLELFSKTHNTWVSYTYQVHCSQKITGVKGRWSVSRHFLQNYMPYLLQSWYSSPLRWSTEPFNFGRPLTSLRSNIFDQFLDIFIKTVWSIDFKCGTHHLLGKIQNSVGFLVSILHTFQAFSPKSYRLSTSTVVHITFEMNYTSFLTFRQLSWISRLLR